MALLRLASADDALAWLRQRGVRGLCTDSRSVTPRDAFIAWPGYALDGRQYVRDALRAGARACLVEAQGVERFDFEDDEAVAALPDLKATTGVIASGFLGRPSERLSVVATTGTNGKTSTAWWTAQALSAAGRRCGVIGTLGIGEPPSPSGAPAELTANPLTTPDPVTLQMAFARFAEAGFIACAIEASSIGIAEQRLAGAHIEVALFTNFTRDHLDYHGSMAAYWDAKAQLFEWPGLKAAVVNIDDDHGLALAERLRGTALELWTCSSRRHARLRATQVRYEDGGLCFELHEGPFTATLRTRQVGDHNVANLLGVIGALRALGLAAEAAVRACAALAPVPGRMQRVEHAGRGPAVVVDYAHTPDALEKVLLALQPLARERGGELWCVFGCGGNRDATKRPLMGAIAVRMAQRVVVTTDNPRHESADFIISQILAGVVGHDEVDVIEDRRAAIVHAVRSADQRDVVLLAGKGHEPYQEVAGIRRAFSDVEEAQAALASREDSA